MKSTQEGVLAGSDYYLSVPTPQAKRFYYYPVAVGEYWCQRPYRVERVNYNSFLLMHILEGTCCLEYGGDKYEAEAGDTIFINCYEPHCYGTKAKLHLRFLHFDGVMAEPFFKEITAQSSVILHGGAQAVQMLQRFRGQEAIQEQEMSLEIETYLMSQLPFVSEQEYSQGVRAACALAKAQYDKALTVHDMAREAHCSDFHFSRLFKKETGSSPYDYLLSVRMEQAKKLLKTTELSMRAVAVICGFGSEINLINCFHKKEGMTPGEFRRLPV